MMENNSENEIKNPAPSLESGMDGEEKSRKSKKEKKRAKKAAKKEAFNALSMKEKALYYGKRLTVVVLLAVVLLGIGKALYMPALMIIYTKVRSELLTKEVSQEELYEMAPIDQELSRQVDAMEPYGQEDTWAVYVYMCGSNLEGGDMSNLSDFSKVLLGKYSNDHGAEVYSQQISLLTGYIDELIEQDMDVPDYMYLNTPMSPKAPEAQQEGAPHIEGCASADIREMQSAQLSDQIKIVIQTGGARAWDLAMVNPNRSQRFILDKDGMRLLEDNHFVNMGDAATLSDFFRFCEKTAPADHKMVIFWDHGAGAFGFAADDLYGGDSLTLKELRQAFEEVYPNDPGDPAFEIVGFDACLMASLETAEAMHGYGRYLAASEEIEPGEGWDYTTWLNKLSGDPALNSAQVGRAIADSFIDWYAKQSVQLAPLGVDYGVTFSILDINEAHGVYGHYCDLADVALKDSIDDMGTLVILGKAASRTVRFATSDYDIFNMVDFTTMIENLRDLYPEETGLIMDGIDRTVVYNRVSKNMSGSKGVSVYFPAEIPDLSSLIYYLDYVKNICLDDSIRALYYYKGSGCLNEEMQAYADSLGYGKAQKLDNTALRDLQYSDITIGPDSFSMALPKVSESLIQADTFYLAMLQDGYAVNFGEDALVKAEDGKLTSTFDGRWLFMGDNILPLERLGASVGTIKYRVKVEYNGADSYMILAVDEESGEVRILGIYDIRSSGVNGEVMAMRNLQKVADGDRFKIIYDKDSFETGGNTELYGPGFTYTKDTKIRYEKVRDGKYLAVFVMYDMRGDAFYSPIAQYEIKDGKILSIEHRSDFIVSTSE